jgi:hypothetical protein
MGLIQQYLPGPGRLLRSGTALAAQSDETTPASSGAHDALETKNLPRHRLEEPAIAPVVSNGTASNEQHRPELAIPSPDVMLAPSQAARRASDSAGSILPDALAVGHTEVSPPRNLATWHPGAPGFLRRPVVLLVFRSTLEEFWVSGDTLMAASIFFESMFKVQMREGETNVAHLDPLGIPLPLWRAVLGALHDAEEIPRPAPDNAVALWTLVDYLGPRQTRNGAVLSDLAARCLEAVELAQLPEAIRCLEAAVFYNNSDMIEAASRRLYTIAKITDLVDISAEALMGLLQTATWGKQHAAWRLALAWLQQAAPSPAERADLAEQIGLCDLDDHGATRCSCMADMTVSAGLAEKKHDAVGASGVPAVRHLSSLMRPRLRATIEEWTDDRVRSVSVSTNSIAAIVMRPQGLGQSVGRALLVWDRQSLQLQHNLKVKAESVILTIDRAITGGRGCPITAWCLRTGKCLYQLNNATPEPFIVDYGVIAPSPAIAVAGDVIITPSTAEGIAMWSLIDGSPVRTPSMQDITCVASTGESQRYVVGHADGTTQVWCHDVCLKTFSSSTCIVRVAISDEFVATIDAQRRLDIYSCRTWCRLNSVNLETFGSFHLVVTNTAVAFTEGYDKCQIWSANSGQLAHTLSTGAVGLSYQDGILAIGVQEGSIQGDTAISRLVQVYEWTA